MPRARHSESTPSALAPGQLTRHEALRHLQAWRDSGMTMVQYAAEAGVSFNRLRGWSAQLNKKPSGRTDGQGNADSHQESSRSFVRLRVVPDPVVKPRIDAALEIVLASGLRIGVRDGIKTADLLLLIRSLEGAAC
jgi:hypothetical protein